MVCLSIRPKLQDQDADIRAARPRSRARPDLQDQDQDQDQFLLVWERSSHKTKVSDHNWDRYTTKWQ